MEHHVPVEVWVKIGLVSVALFGVYLLFIRIYRSIREAWLALEAERIEARELAARQKAIRAEELEVREKDLLGKKEVFDARHRARQERSKKEAEEQAALEELKRLKDALSA